LHGLHDVLLDAIECGSYGRITLSFNYFRNALVQEPVFLNLFPLEQGVFDEFIQGLGLERAERFSEVDVVEIALEPDKVTLQTHLQKMILSYMIYGGILQNKTGEFASRMIAMKNAKDNSQDIIKQLRITYNKARQAAVTQEISEIVSAKVSMES
jgi:F-type H+-transporting ATPase subunit gamma